MVAPPATIPEDTCAQIVDAHSTRVPNLYAIDLKKQTFTFNYEETGVPYNSSSEVTLIAKTEFQFAAKLLPCVVKLDLTPFQQDEINFAGKWVVLRSEGKKSDISIPGFLTYDLGGRTGDPHASERVGGACARQAVTTAQALLAAALYGASEKQLDELFSAMVPVIEALHGRMALNLWMKQQIVDVVLHDKVAPRYPVFFRGLVDQGKETLDTEDREHTVSYLETNNLPDQFWKKVGML